MGPLGHDCPCLAARCPGWRISGDKRTKPLAGWIILAALSGSWQIWKEFSPAQIAEIKGKKRPLISFVLLLREPRYLEKAILAQILSAAWGGDYSSEEGEKTGRFVVANLLSS